MEAIILSNGLPLDNYMAVGIAEGFERAECEQDILLAWSYIGKHQMHLWLQGWFGRTLMDMVSIGYLNENFDVVYEG